MKQATASMGTPIKVITSIYCVVTLGLLLSSGNHLAFLVVGLFLALIAAACYRYSPRAYEIHEGRFILHLHGLTKIYEPYTDCCVPPEKMSMSLRVFGNGGLFSGSGIFWNKQLKFFRAYVTRSQPGDMLLVHAGDKKIMISPEDPQTFLAEAAALKP
jgi:hypothetical protein